MNGTGSGSERREKGRDVSDGRDELALIGDAIVSAVLAFIGNAVYIAIQAEYARNITFIWNCVGVAIDAGVVLNVNGVFNTVETAVGDGEDNPE